MEHNVQCIKYKICMLSTMFENVYNIKRGIHHHKCITLGMKRIQTSTLAIDREQIEDKFHTRIVVRWKKMCHAIILACFLLVFVLPHPIK